MQKVNAAAAATKRSNRKTQKKNIKKKESNDAINKVIKQFGEHKYNFL